MESGNYKEVAMMTKMYKTEVLEILQTDEGRANIGKQTKEEDGKAADNFTQSGREETEDKCLNDTEKEGQEPHTVDKEGNQTSEVSTAMEGSAAADLPSTSIAEESLNEDKRSAIKLEKEVWNSNIKCIEQDFVTCSTEEKGDKAPEEKAELNEEEETADTEINLHVENFPSAPEISDKEIEDKILQKAGSEVPVTAKKISLTEADAEYIIQIDSSKLFSEELSTTEPSELKANEIDLTAKPAESSAYGKNKDLDIPEAREHGTEGCNTVPKSEDQIETIIVNLGDISKQNVQGSSTLSLEEKNFVTPVAIEAPDKEKTLYVKAENPLAAKTTEEDQSTNPENDTIVESINIEKENADFQDEDQELNSSLELSSEESKPGSDVELLMGMNTCEVGSNSEVGKLECSEDEKSLDTGFTKNKSKFEMAVNECYKDVEASGECIDIKKDILEQEDSAKSSEGSSKERVEIEKVDVKFDIEGHSHGIESSETQSSSSGKEQNIEKVDGENFKQMTRDNERAAEGEIIKEVIIKDNSCTKELHMIPITEEAVNEVTGQDLAPIQSIGVTASNHIEMVESKFPEDLQQESEESAISKTQDKEIKEVIKKPADMSSLASEVSEEKIKEESIEEADNGDNEIAIAPGMITEATGLAEVQLNDMLAKVLDSISESKSLQTSKTADTSQQDAEVDSMKVEEASNMVSQLPSHEYERIDHESMNLEKSDTSNIEVKETKLPETVSMSRDHSVNEIHGRDMSLTVGERDTNQTEKQITEIPEASSSEPINQGVEGDSSHEIIAPIVATEVTSFEEVRINQESIKALDISPDAKHGETIKTANAVEQDAEVNRMKLEETSKMACQLPTYEHEKAENENITAENLEANEVEVEETKTPDAVSESNDQGVKEIPETGTSLDMEETNINAIEKQIGEIRKPLAELINQDEEESRDDETSLVPVPQAEKNEEQHQVPSSALLSINQGIETTTTIERMPNVSPEYDDTEVDNLRLVAVSSVVSQLPVTECKPATNENIEKSDADDADIIETKLLDVAPGSKDQIIEEIHETKTSRSTEIIDTDKREAEIKVVTEEVSDLRNLGADIVAESEILDHPAPPGTLGEQLQVSTYALSFNRQDCEASTTIKKIEDKSTEEDETQVEKTKLEDAEGMLYTFSTIEQKNKENRSAIIAKSDAAQVKVEEAKISELISDSEIRGVQESPSMGRTHSDKVEVHIKAVPETIYDLNYQGDEAESFRDDTVNQIAIQRKEQSLISLSPSFKELNCETTQSQVISDEATKIDKTQLVQNIPGSPTGTTEKPHLQDEGPRELEVSSLQVKLHDSQNNVSEEDSMVLEEASKLETREYIPGINYADSPREYEKTAVDLSSPNTSTYEGITDSGNSNEDTNNLTPCSTLRDLLKGELDAKCEDLKFDKFREVLETMSESHSPEVFPISIGTDSVTGKSTRDGKNHSDRTTKAEEAIKKDILKEKIFQEKQVTVNSYLVSPHEERVTESTQEVEQRAEDYRGDKANTTLEASRNEVQHDLVYEEFVEAGADKKLKEIITAQDRTLDPYPLHVGEGTAIVSHQEEAKDGKVAQKVCIILDLEDQGDETNFKDTEKETTAPIEEFNRSKEMLISFEENRAADSVKTMASSKNEQQQSAELAVPPVRDEVTEEAPEQNTGKNFEEVSEPSGKGNKDTSNAHAINVTVADTATKEAPHEKVGKNFEEVSRPSVKRPSHGIIARDEEDKEMSSDYTINVVSHTDNEKINLTSLEPAPEGCVVAEVLNLEEQEVWTNIPSISSCPVTLEEILAEKESKKPLDEKEHNVLYGRRAEAGSILKGMSSIQFEGHRNDEDPVELSMKGNKRTLDETKTHSVTTATGDEETQRQDGRPNVLSHMKDSDMEADERELIGNKEELQTEKSEMVRVEQAKTDEEKDEEEEGGECKRSGLDSDAPVMVEATRDTDVKIAHKKSHNILSGVGSKVKHSLAKVKKAITGKPSHQKPPSQK
ncbi:uncharacterized protein LOC127799274 [Diospyros lotus]|uniref:uncharacterized protein LOC127799274 n=1 Tax=Diospyros lotus TaxID=55363 RepID=UPI0022553417|nr:uncharacterized protein LOC127799274 [Diospyros lotus]